MYNISLSYIIYKAHGDSPKSYNSAHSLPPPAPAATLSPTRNLNFPSQNPTIPIITALHNPV